MFEENAANTGEITKETLDPADISPGTETDSTLTLDSWLHELAPNEFRMGDVNATGVECEHTSAAPETVILIIELAGRSTLGTKETKSFLTPSEIS
jgi:hypothetical protein